MSKLDMCRAVFLRLLFVVLPGFLLQAQEPEPQITGRVTQATNGSPIKGVDIRLIPPFVAGQLNFQTARTDSDGVYRFLQVREGTYSIEASGDGFVPQTYKRDASPEALFQRVNSSTKLTGINFQLVREAVISGIVTTAEARPAAGVSVAVVPNPAKGSVHLRPFRATTTDAKGTFVFKGLPAGAYLVCVNGPQGFNVGPDRGGWYRERWYKNANSAESALPVTVDVGEERSGLEIVVEKEKRFNVIVRPSGPDGQAKPESYSVILEHRSHSSTRQPDGSYLIPAIPAGHYTLVATAWSGVQYEGQGRTSFNVSDADVTVPVYVGGLGEIEGQVKWVGASGAGDLMIAINSEEAAQSVHIDTQGHFAFARVLPARYRFKLLRHTPGVLLRSVVCGGKEVTDDLLLEMGDRQKVECAMVVTVP